MNDYSSSIKKVNDQLLGFINRYEILDNADPIDNKLLKKLLKIINSFNTTSNQHVTSMNSHIENFDDFFAKILNKNQTQQTIIENNLKESLKVISEKYINKINQLNDEINLLKVKNQSNIESLKTDIEFNLIASNQREEIFEIEYEENVRRFDYQISNAKETYNNNIIIHNTNKQTDEATLTKEYNQLVQNYIIETDQLIEKLKLKISENKEKLVKINEQLNVVRNQMKERLRQESVNLNTIIKQLLDDKNKAIVNARTRYTTALADSSTEKENKRIVYQTESQKILKNFVYNMTELDNMLNENKSNFEYHISEDVRPFLYELFKLTKEEEIAIKEILSSTILVNDEYDKKTKKIISTIKREYFSKINNLNLRKQNHLTLLELMNQLYIENNNNNKILLELEKNYQTKILTEKEQSDNKYYQELSSVYENDMNLLIHVANLRYNQKANLVKCQSRIRSYEIEYDFSTSEANFQKEMEEIQTEIAKYTLEMEGAIKLKELLLAYENNKYTTSVKHLSVITLLEIEKCKLLNEYNHRQYNLNVLNSKTNLLYSKKKISIINEKFEALQNIVIDKSNELLLRDIVNTAYKIKEDQLYEAEEQSIETRTAQYQLDSNNHELLYQRFTGEIKNIHHILSTFIMLIKDLEVFTNKFLNAFFSSIAIRPIYTDVVNIFVNDFLKIISDYYQSLLNSLVEHESEIILKRIDFEEKFKFKVFYNDLLTKYESERKKLLTKNKNIQDTLDNYIKTVEMFKNKIYDIENQNQQIKLKLRTNFDREQRGQLKDELQKNNQKISDLKKKISDITGFKNILQKDVVTNTEELKLLDDEYNKRVEEIKKMQYNGAISFYALRNGLSKIGNSNQSKFVGHFNIELLVENKKSSPSIEIQNLRRKFMNHNKQLFQALYSLINSFYKKTILSIEKDKQLLLINYKNEIQRIYTKSNKEIHNNQIEFNKKISEHLNKISKLEDFYISEETRYDNLIKESEQNYERESEQIRQTQKESLATFYREYYAVCSNLDEINKIYNQDILELTTNFENDQNNLATYVMNEKSKLTINLNSFIRDKNSFINNIPVSFKYQSQDLQTENKQINNNLENEIKELKNKASITRKAIQKDITTINNTLNETISHNEEQLQIDIDKENKRHHTQVKHLERLINKYQKQIR